MTPKKARVSKDAGKMSIGAIVAIAVVIIVGCIGMLTIDSCKRLDRQCFGTSWTDK